MQGDKAILTDNAKALKSGTTYGLIGDTVTIISEAHDNVIIVENATGERFSVGKDSITPIN